MKEPLVYVSKNFWKPSLYGTIVLSIPLTFLTWNIGAKAIKWEICKIFKNFNRMFFSMITLYLVVQHNSFIRYEHDITMRTQDYWPIKLVTKVRLWIKDLRDHSVSVKGVLWLQNWTQFGTSNWIQSWRLVFHFQIIFNIHKRNDHLPLLYLRSRNERKSSGYPESVLQLEQIQPLSSPEQSQ